MSVEIHAWYWLLIVLLRLDLPCLRIIVNYFCLLSLYYFDDDFYVSSSVCLFHSFKRAQMRLILGTVSKQVSRRLEAFGCYEFEHLASAINGRTKIRGGGMV